jgi:hypothetical protein
MEANTETENSVIKIPDTYPNEFKAVDIDTGHEYRLIGMNETHKENNKVEMVYRVSITKRRQPC